MNKILASIILFQLIFSTVQASIPTDPQKIRATVYTIGGRQQSGEIKQLPYVNSISVDLQSGSRVETISSDHIEYMEIWNTADRQSTPVRLIYVPSYEFKSIKSGQADFNDQPKWMIRLCDLDNLSVYMVAQQYDLTRHKVRSVESLTEATPPNHWLYMVRKGEKYPTRITLSPESGYGSNQHFRAAGAKYFQDCPGLSERISNGEMTNKDIVDVILYYNEWKNKN